MSCRDPSGDACAVARHVEHVEGCGSSVCRGGYKGRRTTLTQRPGATDVARARPTRATSQAPTHTPACAHRQSTRHGTQWVTALPHVLRPCESPEKSPALLLFIFTLNSPKI